MDIVGVSLDFVWVWENKGNFIFTSKPLETPSNNYFNACVVSDFTGDGLPDLAVSSNQQIDWYKNKSLSNFEYERRMVSTVSPAYFIKALDLNNDGAMDILASNGKI
jgi:hypothetical protein